ncbi:MAG: Ig-like domain repeat protein, partial [Acidobacteria bacterium]|nr:Ig-like domain repeat protein [Acidobacteriota bacterium]
MKTRSFLTFLGLLAALMVIAPVARAQTTQKLAVDGFNPNPNGTVRAIAVQADGHILLGGEFTSPLNHILRLAPSGLAIDPFNPNPNGAVSAIVVQPDGKIVVTGSFTGLGGIGNLAGNYLARLNPDGTLDPNFQGGLQSPAMALQSDGKILGLSIFTGYGSGYDRAYRLNTNGTLDSSFQNHYDVHFWTPRLHAVAVQPDGKVLIAGGAYDSGSGAILRLTADGYIDWYFGTTFRNTDGSPCTNPDHDLNLCVPATMVDGAIYAIQVQPDGKILVGGDFSTLAGVGRSSLGRLNPNGSLDTDFHSPLEPSAIVYSIALQADGRMVLGGTDFGSKAVPGGGSGRVNVQRINADGSRDDSLTEPTFLADYSAYGSVYALATNVAPNPYDALVGKIIGGGTFAGLFDELNLNWFGRRNVARMYTTPSPYDPQAVQLASQQLSVDPSFVDTGQLTWTYAGTFPEPVWAVLQFSTDGANWSTVATATRITSGGGWTGTVAQTLVKGYFRALGHYTSGQYNGSGSVIASPTVQVDNAYDSTTNIAGPSGAWAGDPVTFTATVSSSAPGDAPTGIVTFKDGNTTICAQPLTSGQATCTTSFAALGYHYITAGYSGAAEFRASASPSPLGLMVGGVPTFTTLASSPNPSTAGQSVTLTATVTRGGGDIAPPAIVTFFDGTTVLGSATVTSGGVATLETLALATSGRHGITAQYAGSYGYGASTSAVLTQQVVILPLPPDDFNPGANLDVLAIAVQADGKTLVGGSFTTLGGQPRNYIGRLNADGTLDAGFNPGADRPVRAIAVQLDGRILVGGQFTQLGGQPCNHLGRLNSNGSIETCFDVRADDAVWAFAVQPDGKILVGGAFTLVAGQLRNHVARLNANGTLDASFNPGADAAVLAFFSQSDQGVAVFALQPDGKILMGSSNGLVRLKPDGIPEWFLNDWHGVYTLAVQPDGKILMGGSFGIERLNTDGSLDSGFTASLPGSLYAMALQADGKIWVGGSFHPINDPLYYLYRLNSDGSVDFSTQVGISAPVVYALAIQPGGQVLVGGHFQWLGDQSRSYIGRLTNDTAASREFNFDVDTAQLTWALGGSSPELMWTAFEFSTDGSTWSPVVLAPNTTVARTAGGWAATLDQPHVTGTLRALGYYGTGMGSGSVVTSTLQVDYTYDTTTIVAVSPATPQMGAAVTLTATVSPVAPGTGTPAGSVAFFSGGIPIAGCGARALGNGQATCNTSFSAVGVYTITARYGGDGNFRTSTSSDFPLSVSPVPALTATTLISSPNPSITNQSVTLTATVTSPGVVPAGNVTFFDGATMIGTGTLNASGVATLATSFAINGTHSITAQYAGSAYVLGSTSAVLSQQVVSTTPPDSFNPGLAGNLSAIAVQPDGKIVLGGSFAIAGGDTHSIARLNPDGTVDSGFNPGDSQSVVRALAVQADGRILVGGSFSALDGSGPMNVARLGPDGTLDSTFTPPADGGINTLAVQPDGKILLGGYFTSLGGESRSRIGRLDPNGSLDSTFNPGASSNLRTRFVVWSIQVQPDGKILVAGDFDTLAGSNRPAIGRLNANGSIDTTFTSPFQTGTSIYAIAVQPDGKVLVSGGLAGSAGFILKRLNTDGSIDTTFASPLPTDGNTYAIALQTDGRILLCGYVGSAAYLYRLNSNGTFDETFTSQIDGSAASIVALQSDGKVLVGGWFSAVDGQPRSGIARLTNNIAASQEFSLDVNAGRLTWMRGGSSPELMWTAFESSTDGSTWSPVVLAPNTTVTRTAGGWSGSVAQPHVKGTFRALGYYGTGPSSGSLLISTLHVDHAYDSTTAVSVSPGSPREGESATITATVSPVSPGTGTPTGSVAFFSGGSPIEGCGAQALGNGQATCITSFGAVGVYTITAQYGGEAGFHGSTSSDYPLSVISKIVATATSISAPGISYGADSTVTVTVTASGGSAAPTGSVSLIVNNGAPVSQGLAAGPATSSAATFTLTKLSAGSHTLSAAYAPTGNFSTSEAGGSSLTVNQATLTIHVSAAGTNYTGLAYAGATSCTADGVNGEHPAGTLSFEDSSQHALSGAPTNAGSYYARCSAGGTETNYAATSGTAPFTISPAAPTVTVSGGPFTYDGTSHEATCTVTGVSGATVAGTCTLTYDGSASAPIAAKTSYVVAATFTSSDTNYSSGTGHGSLTIGKRPAMWTTSSNSKTYGALDPVPLTAGSGTFLTADHVSATYTRASGNTAVGGPYHITATLVDPDGKLVNYEPVTNTGASFTISPATPTVTVSGGPFTYDGTSHEATCTVSGVSDPTVAGTCTLTYDGSASAPIAAKTSYAVAATFTSGDTNYSGGTGHGSLTISQRAATWTTNPNSKTYGALDPSPLTTGSGSNFVAADGVTATYGRTAGDTVAGGPYPITATLSPAGVLSNYTITNAGADFTINPKVASVTPTVAGKTYGDV